MDRRAPQSGTTPLQLRDAAEVAGLFYRAFRDGRTPPDEFVDYFRESFFGSPTYDQALGGLVHRGDEGAIDGALLVIPMRVVVHGRLMTGRLMSNYMTDPGKRTKGGAEMVLTIRARNQDFCFSDSANPVSADHWKAVGGHVLPIQSLDFRRVFRPVGWMAMRLTQRLPKSIGRLLQAATCPLDAVLRWIVPRLGADGPIGSRIEIADFVTLAPGLVERFAVHPAWQPEELGWLLDMAARNIINGPLHLREVRDGKGHLAGALVFYARPGGTARVLNILSRRGREELVVGALLAELDAMGCLAVEGMAQPFLMEALSRQAGMGFVPRGAYCISTRHAEIVDAAKRGDVYLGGLMGEDWSRLVTDFHH
ncbi:GNAT family N-acetyltransferase [Devosia sp. SL43]|uniref:GNAT family N-acetyltransferase n=1 Tax=Devosia sp. SL43 TaxID=2806348 RepID=UPI001F17F8BA|nr:GNAT family N-acetyltransferase [Devosia sp. SL43]UJW84819.1 GNAT family N-acetyltransferase [Devosia sp. SL43]